MEDDAEDVLQDNTKPVLIKVKHNDQKQNKY